MPFARSISTALLLIASASSATAADFSDPTWPCVQRKVEQLSVGLMWPHPLDAGFAPDEAARQDISALAETLALRRVDLEDAGPDIEAFAERHERDEASLGAVFARVFDEMSKRRARIIDGIAKFSLGQIALAERIDAARLEMETLMAADEPDFDRMDAVEEQLDWAQVIHSDRQRSITYLCETPVILERRLYAIARMLQEATLEDG